MLQAPMRAINKLEKSTMHERPKYLTDRYSRKAHSHESCQIFRKRKDYKKRRLPLPFGKTGPTRKIDDPRRRVSIKKEDVSSEIERYIDTPAKST